MLTRAAEWYAELRSQPSPIGQAAFERWLAADQAHREAWRRVQAISGGFEPLREGADAVLTLDTLATLRRHKRRSLLAGAIAFGGGLLGLGLWQREPLGDALLVASADRRTATGAIEQFDIDGATLWLNTASAIDRQAGAPRSVLLRQGELFIDSRAAATIATRGGTLALANGRCAVRRDADGSEVHLYEGSAALRTDNGSERVLHAGQSCRFSAGGAGPLAAADPAREAWTRGLLLAQNLRLDALLAELAKYQHGHLGVAPEVAGLRVLGGFPATDPQRALAMLEQVLPVRVRRVLPWWTVVEPRAV